MIIIRWTPSRTTFINILEYFQNQMNQRSHLNSYYLYYKQNSAARGDLYNITDVRGYAS